MTDLPPDPDSNVDSGVRPGHGSTPSTPRWVKVSAIIFIALVLLFLILHLTGNGLGPGVHTPP
ncbi:MAG: hypothetical protein ACRDHG_00080 [Anaerolineales bacterium]